jgi:hypothetical protein
MSERLFGPTPEAKRRGVLFALSLTTAAICLIAATTTFLGPGANTTIALGLGAGSLVFVAFALLLYGGHLGSLFTDDQLFWRVMELER